MRQTLSRGAVVAAAATGVLSLCGSPAMADAQAEGGAANSPGVLSGNTVQAPVHVPVNACGNTVNVAAALNPAFGNTCANISDGADGSTASGASAEAITEGSPGVLSGNTVQAPIDVPVNACGNSVNVVGALNPAFGNSCENVEGTPTTTTTTVEEEPTPLEETAEPLEGTPEPVEEPAETPVTVTDGPQTMQESEPQPALAETGSMEEAGGIAAAGAAMVAAGAMLYRRSRATARG
ncbi:chaplin [Streptomyces sp. ZYX-F-203]